MNSEKHSNFANNLRRIRKERDYTFVEFSKALDVPKSTLQTILADGNSTLATAIHISERLNIPLDVLLSEEPTVQEFNTVRWLMSGSEVFRALSPEQQDQVADLIRDLLEILRA